MRALVVAPSQPQRRFVSWLLQAVPGLQVSAEWRLDLARQRLAVEPFALVAVALPQSAGAPAATPMAHPVLTMLARVRTTPGPNASGAWILLAGHAQDAGAAEHLGMARVLVGPVPAEQLVQAAHEQLYGEAWPLPPRRRRWTRLRAPAWAHIETNPRGAAAGAPAGPHAVADLGAAGAFIAAGVPPPTGTQGHLELALPHVRAPLSLPFEVVHRRGTPGAKGPAGFGVRFGERPPPPLVAALHAPLGDGG